jgi:hypothetical protein
MRPGPLVLLLSGSLTFAATFCPAASAQEIEPNDTCQTAQDRGAITGPGTIPGGSLDSQNPPNPPSDVDFFRFTAPPERPLSVWTTSTSRIGVFNESCELIVATPLFEFFPRVDFEVPASGTIIVAIAEFTDEFFNGMSGGDSGPYQIMIGFTIESITGRLVNAVSGAPIVGGPPGSSGVRLDRPGGGIPVSFVNIDANGEFRIDSDIDAFPIDAGEYELRTSVDGFEVATRSFSVGHGESLDLGDIALTPFPLQFTNVRPCPNIGAQGGTCRYSVTVVNNTESPLAGQALSLVTAGRDESVFEASTRRVGRNPVRAQLSIPARSSRDLTFFFDVPSLAPISTEICAQIQVGVNPAPLFNMVRQDFLFCLRRGAASFEVMRAEEGRALFDLMQGQGAFGPPLK